MGDNIYNGKINIDLPERDQRNLLKKLVKFNDKFRPRIAVGKDKKRNIYDSAYALHEGREFLMLSQVEYFQ